MAAMVVGIPAIRTPAAGTMDRKMIRFGDLAWLDSAALHRWCCALNGSLVNGSRERITLSRVVVPDESLSQLETEGLERLPGGGI